MRGTNRFDDEDSFGSRRPTPYLGGGLHPPPLRAISPAQTAGNRHDDVRIRPRGSRHWRTPAVVIVCGCLIAMLSFGPRSALGQFLTPMSMRIGWGRDVFSLRARDPESAVGRGPAVRRRRSPTATARVRVLWAGAIAYAAGLALMAYATTPAACSISRPAC